MKRKIPTFKNDKEAQDFVDTADLTQYDLSGAKPLRFEFEKRTGVNMRLPESLLEAVKDSAKARMARGSPINDLFSNSANSLLAEQC